MTISSLLFHGIFPDRSKDFSWSISFASKNIDDSEKSNSSLTEKPYRVLLADDDEDDRELFKEALDNTEFNTKLEVSRDGKELLEKLQSDSQKPDLIILDLNMPYKNGKECLEFIRCRADYNHIPVVIYSTSSSIVDIEDTYEKGANLYISKPSSFNELIKIVKNLLTMDWETQLPKSSRKMYYFKLKKHGYG